MDNFWFGIIKEYYGLGLYNDKDLDLFVEGNLITSDEKASILGADTAQVSE